MEWLTKFLLCRSFSFMVYQWTSVSVYSFLSFIFFIFSPSSFTAHSFSFVVASFHFLAVWTRSVLLTVGKHRNGGKKERGKGQKVDVPLSLGCSLSLPSLRWWQNDVGEDELCQRMWCSADCDDRSTSDQRKSRQGRERTWSLMVGSLHRERKNKPVGKQEKTYSGAIGTGCARRRANLGATVLLLLLKRHQSILITKRGVAGWQPTDEGGVHCLLLEDCCCCCCRCVKTMPITTTEYDKSKIGIH